MILSFATAALADEGMWMAPSVNKKTSELIGCVVSLDFMGTGSLISGNGLVITNHHVAYGDVFDLSTKEHNYLHDGFWARTLQEEIPIPRRQAHILRETIDVTDEVQELVDNGTVKNGVMMMRKLSSIMEKRYHEKTGYEAWLSSAWKGAKYYISLYDVYQDVRLVGVPPMQVGAFGGDVDNWEWPQHKGDFALLRIYTAPDGSSAAYSPDNVPLKNAKYLKISTKGYREGSKTTLIGFPGSTDRYASSAKAQHLVEVQLPIQTEILGAQLGIIKKWMDRDPEIRRKYSDYFFGLANRQELYLGELQCYKRFNVIGEKRRQEEELDAWLDADPARRTKYGDISGMMKDRYESLRTVYRNYLFFREAIIRGNQLEAVASRMSMLLGHYVEDRAAGVRKSNARNFESSDLRVERELFRYGIEAFFENVEERVLGPFQKELKERFGQNYDAMCAEVWDKSWLSDPEKVKACQDEATDLKAFLEANADDPLMRFYADGKMLNYNNDIKRAQKDPDISYLAPEYTHAMYEMQVDKKMKVYPDANSTLRVNYGKVCALNPRDAVHCDWYSTVGGLLEKHDTTEFDFTIPADVKAVLETVSPKMKVNFITDNDSTGGNSGSPIINSRGELIGLLFDGNKESLASEMLFTPDYNRSVCVDIRYVLFLLRNYAHLDNILSEIGL